MPVSETDRLEAVLNQTQSVIAAVKPEQSRLPTPCPDFDVARIVDHLVGWASSFAARVTGASFEGDPNDFRSGPDPAAEFGRAARSIVEAYRAGGPDSKQLPIGVLLMEFVTHGWDLATATGQSFDIDPETADETLEMGRRMLQPQYRGPGKSFGLEVEVPGSAGSVDKLVAFMGRRPDWRAGTA